MIEFRIDKIIQEIITAVDFDSEINYEEIQETIKRVLTDNMKPSNLIPHINNDNENIWIPIEDILFLKKNESDSITQTRNGVYKNFINLPDSYEFFKNYGFELFGKSLIVNLKEVKRYNSRLYLIYFDEIVSEKTIKIEVTGKIIDYLKRTLGLNCDVIEKNKNSEVEYSPLFPRKSIVCK